MWSISLFLLLQSVIFIDAEFGMPYLKKSRLCRPWDCVAKSLSLPDTLPAQSAYELILKSLLPEEWHEAIGKAVDACYHDRRREYTNTCVGQALLHCTLDNLIENCPEDSIRHNDACNPVATTAGMNYMFTQSRYKDLELNLPKERRPVWFMRQYFDTKCCAVPELINGTVLSECGFRTFLRYYENEPKQRDEHKYYVTVAKPTTNKPKKITDSHKTNEDYQDPLECCDIEDFISPTRRTECNFHLSYDSVKRFSLTDKIEHNSTTVAPEVISENLVNRDIKVVPLSCSKETCIFNQLNVISESGAIDINAFSKVLDNFTTLHPSWSKAKARVITQCLNRRANDYNADCEINELLGCALDVFSENCPHKKKNHICRHSRRNNTVCQISSSKYRPKNRRAVCGLPHLVDSDVLSRCGVTSVSQVEYVAELPAHKPTNLWNNDFSCRDSPPSTLCLMHKMGVRNKYDFMDYFRMKDKIRTFTATNPEWGALTEIYMNVFSSLPLYEEYCNSPKKLLNVIDAMITTCPLSKRKKTQRCNKLFDDVIKNPPAEIQNLTKDDFEKILETIPTSTDLPSTDLPSTTEFSSSSDIPSTTPKDIEMHVKPVIDHGILSTSNEPEDVVIDVTPDTESTIKTKSVTKPPLILLPVYMRMNSTHNAESNTREDGIFQYPSYKMHGRVNSTGSLKPLFVV